MYNLVVGNAIQFLTTDALGSTRLMTDQHGNPVARYDYLPFGQEVPGDVNARSDVICGSVSCYGQYDAIRHKFTAKERDAEPASTVFFFATTRQRRGVLLAPIRTVQVLHFLIRRVGTPIVML